MPRAFPNVGRVDTDPEAASITIERATTDDDPPVTYLQLAVVIKDNAGNAGRHLVPLAELGTQAQRQGCKAILQAAVQEAIAELTEEVA